MRSHMICRARYLIQSCIPEVSAYRKVGNLGPGSLNLSIFLLERAVSFMENVAMLF